MAFHDGLSRRQQMVLAITCFPLLPFYLCYICFARSKEEEGKSDTLGDPVTVEIHPRHPTPQTEYKALFRKGIKVFPSVTTQVSKAQAEEGKVQEAGRQPRLSGDPVTVEIHPRHPTPQTDYKALFRKGFRGIKISQDQGLFAYPWDKSSLKSMPIDLQQFQELDAYAAKVDLRSNVEGLVSALLRLAHSDLEKVRAIWTWICHHIEYDLKAYHCEAEGFCKPTDVFQSRKSVCSGYARLFEKMCSIAGIKCKNLSGYTKGYSYKIGTPFKDTTHVWNAVYLDGKWHLLDSTWGSGHVDHSCTKFTFRYNEFYFLTHPALFITDHFPENRKWQLLKPTLKLEQFKHNVQYGPSFYKLGLVAAFPETSVIETENGKATILIESHAPALFLCNMNGLNEHCLMMLQRNGMKLEVYPRQIGTHSLKIFAKPFKDKKGYTHVLEYSLKCSSVDESMCMPQTLLYPVGPSWHTEENGILKAWPTSPVIHTDDGRCIVTFTRSKDLNFFATLDSDTSTVPESTRRRHTWTTCRGDLVELKIHLPHAGNFALYIWTQKKSDAGANQCALSYLLSCQNKSVKWPHFPQNYTSWEDDFELVAPLAGVLSANCEVQFKLRLPGVAEASVECGKRYPLTLSRDGFWEGACHTSGASKVTVKISKNTDNTFWYLLAYKVKTF